MPKHNEVFAFPSLYQRADEDGRQGMTLRDWYAGQALAGMCAASDRSGSFVLYAKDAYAYADAMLAERSK